MVVVVVAAVAVKHCQGKDWYESLCFIYCIFFAACFLAD